LFRNIEVGQSIDATEVGKLCKLTEGKTIPFDQVHAAIESIRPARKGELTQEEFIKVKF
jgi:hypothetical protein